MASDMNNKTEPAKKAFVGEPSLESPDDSMSLDFPDVEFAVMKSRKTESIKKKKQTKSGAKEILDGLKKKQTSGKMIDKQMDFTTKLAQYEVVQNEREVEKAEAGLSHMFKIPRPLDWIKNPGRPTLWFNLEGGGAESLNEESPIMMKQLAKITKSDCMKYINIVVHPHLLKAWYLAPLVAEAKGVGCKVVEGSGPCHRVIGFSRVVPKEITGDTAKTMRLSDSHRCSRRFLYILQSSDAADFLEPLRLTIHMEQRKHVLKGQITLVILDTDNILATKNWAPNFETSATELLVVLEIDTLVVRSSDELVSTVLQFAKAVAEEPAKLARRAVDENAEFYMRGDNKNCVAVDQQGNGLARLWQQMLSVLPQSSLEVSRAIAVDYSSPKLLAEALRGPGGVSRVADVGVARSAVPGARARRLGPEMSQKLHKLFTLSGDVVVE